MASASSAVLDRSCPSAASSPTTSSGRSIQTSTVWYREPVTIEHVVDHFDRVAKFVGVEHVAIRSDMDLVGNPNAVNGGGFDPKTQPNFSRYQYHEDADGAITIRGLNHAKPVYDLTEALVRRGYSDRDIAAILVGNAIRVLGTIWPNQSNRVSRFTSSAARQANSK